MSLSQNTKAKRVVGNKSKKPEELQQWLNMNWYIVAASSSPFENLSNFESKRLG